MSGSNLPVTTQDDSALLDFGATKMRPGDFIPPRVKVLQQMSGEVADKQGDPGDLFNVLTGENYGPEMRILPILPFMQRILLVRRDKREPVENALATVGLELAPGDGLLCRSYDMEQGKGSPGIACDACPLAEWDRETNAPPLCTETHNLAAMNEMGELVVLSFQRSSAKVGKRLFSILRMRPAKPWSTFLTIKTRLEKGDKGPFYVPDVTIDRSEIDTGLTAQAITWATQLKGVTIDVAPPTEDDGVEVTPGADPF